jgi:RNA polymerase sigma-70 factor (ECF subfamily)
MRDLFLECPASGAALYRGRGDRVPKAVAQHWRAREAADPRLVALRAGEAAVIEEVLHELLPRVRGWLYRRLGPDGGLDDATQEALTEIARALPRYQGHSSLGVYAYRITARVASRQVARRVEHRKRFAVDGGEAKSVPSDGRDPEQSVLEREALNVVLSCLSRLPSRRREAFILVELEGMSAQEAAEHVGVTAQAIRARVMHARRELQRRLHGHDAVARYRGAP